MLSIGARSASSAGGESDRKIGDSRRHNSFQFCVQRGEIETANRVWVVYWPTSGAAAAAGVDCSTLTRTRALGREKESPRGQKERFNQTNACK